MSLPAKIAPRLRYLLPGVRSSTRPFTSTASRAQDEQWPQRQPLCRFYELLVESPLPPPVGDKPPTSAEPEPAPTEKKEPVPAPPPTKKKPGRKPKSVASSTQDPTPAGDPITDPPIPQPMTPQQKAGMVFGSPELKRNEEAVREANKKAQSINLAGVMVPPRPAEPDNCCMSGCVNCVWDLYRDEMEEWTAKKNEAQMRMKNATGTKPKIEVAPRNKIGVQVGETKIAKDLWDDDTFQNVPVGIREFMRLEKKLRDTEKQQD